MTLATEALGGRVVEVTRTIRDANAKLPTPAELKAQLEQTFGPSSGLDAANGGAGRQIVYAWSDEGLIADLAAVPYREMEFNDGYRNKKLSYRPCMMGGRSGAEYKFAAPRHEPLKPGCVATMTVDYLVGASVSQITFRLTDYDLVRKHEIEADSQILKALEAPVEASKMDL